MCKLKEDMNVEFARTLSIAQKAERELLPKGLARERDAHRRLAAVSACPLAKEANEEMSWITSTV